MALRDRETREKASGRLVRREQRGWIVESEGWGKMVEKEEEESAMAKGLKLEVTIDEAIAEEVWEREIGIRRGTLPPGLYSGTSSLALVARASAFSVGLVYGSMKLKFLKVSPLSLPD